MWTGAHRGQGTRLGKRHLNKLTNCAKLNSFLQLSRGTIRNGANQDLTAGMCSLRREHEGFCKLPALATIFSFTP